MNPYATRIEELTGSPEVELKGTVSCKTATTFQIFGLTVNFSSAVIEPAGAAVNTRALVEVEGYLGAVFDAFPCYNTAETRFVDSSVSVR